MRGLDPISHAMGFLSIFRGSWVGIYLNTKGSLPFKVDRLDSQIKEMVLSGKEHHEELVYLQYIVQELTRWSP